MRKLKITLSGGFHNSDDKTILAKVVDKENREEIWNGMADGAYISKGQLIALRNHFCGITDCICGSWSRADMILPRGWARNKECITFEDDTTDAIAFKVPLFSELQKE